MNNNHRRDHDWRGRDRGWGRDADWRGRRDDGC